MKSTGVAVASHLDDKGPTLFKEVRVGRERRPIVVMKFRSMRDEKITRVGRWLRRTGIDELPQFINVMRGEMGVVGPRPLTAADVERLGWVASNTLKRSSGKATHVKDSR